MSKSTHIYVVSCGDMLKIGITNNIEKRMKTFKTGNPIPIVLEYLEERKDPMKAEQYVLNQLSKYRIPGTEWLKGTTVNEIRIKLMMFHDQP